MANPSHLPADMKLYSPAEPEGRVFLKGEQWPGDAWSPKPGGEGIAAKTATAALADIAEAEKRFAGLQEQYASLEHDLAQACKSRDEAVAELDTLKRAAAEAEKSGGQASEEAREAVQARDQAANEAAEQRRRADDLDAKLTAANETIERIMGELSAAQQAAANAGDRDADRTRIMELETDLANANQKAADAEGLLGLANEEIATLKAEIAKVDGDGDGKVGGGKKKADS